MNERNREVIEFIEFYMKKYLKSQRRKRYLRNYRRKVVVIAKSSASKIKGLSASFLIIDDPFFDSCPNITKEREVL